MLKILLVLFLLSAGVVHGNVIDHCKSADITNGGAGFKRDSIHRFTGHTWTAITVPKLDSSDIGVGQPWPRII